MPFVPDELAQETTQVTQASGGNERLQVVVDVEGVFTTLRVPPAGELPIGRASNSAVRIDHLSVSRNHG